MFKRTLQQSRSLHTPVSEAEEPVAKRQKPVPVETESTEQGRPYQAFVEREASQFRQEMTQAGDRTEPAPEEIRAHTLSAMQLDLMDRRVGKSQYSVAGEEQHGLMDNRSESQLSVASASPAYIDTLMRLAKDARWVSREFSPERMDRSCSPAYYTRDRATGTSVPGADSLIQRPGLETVEEEPMERETLKQGGACQAFVERRLR